MINILLADDHAIMRKGLREILAKISDMKIVDETNNENELLHKAENKDYDVILLDASINDRQGASLLKLLKSKKPELPIIVLNMFSKEQNAALILKEGAAGYLTKESEPEELVVAIREVYHGKKYINPAIAQKIAFDLTSIDEKPALEILSDREYQVLLLIAQGKTLKEIAVELNLSIKTISYYRSKILIKMKMKNNADIIRYALKNQLVD